MQYESIKKQDYLKQYIPKFYAVKEIEKELEDLKKEYQKLIHENGYSHYLKKLKQLKEQLLKYRYQKISTYTEIYKRIEELDDETEKRLLKMKYLYGYTWERVSDEMGYSVRQVYNIHNKALEHFSL